MRTRCGSWSLLAPALTVVFGCGQASAPGPGLQGPGAQGDGQAPRRPPYNEAIVRDGDEAFCFGYKASTRAGSEALLKTRTWCLETLTSCEDVRRATAERVQPLGGAITVGPECRVPFLMSCHTSISREFGPAQTCSLLETECSELRDRKRHSPMYQNVSDCGLVRPRQPRAALR